MNDIETVLAVVVLSTLTWLLCDWLWEHGIRWYRRRQVRHLLKECRHVDFDRTGSRLVERTSTEKTTDTPPGHVAVVRGPRHHEESGYLTTTLRRVK